MFHDWCTNRAKKKSRRSSTQGKTKATCHPTPEAKMIAKRSRSYKLGAAYLNWCKACDRMNAGGTTMKGSK